MSGFGQRQADTILRKLGADVTNTHHVVGLVHVDPTHRIRLYYSHGTKAFPDFVEYKWRQALRLSPTEFRLLHQCPLSGEVALAMIRERLGLDEKQ